jgi:hypothetical protein
MNGESDESQCDVVSTEDEHCCEDVLLEPHPQLQSEHTVCSRAQYHFSLDTASAAEQDDDIESGPGPRQNRHLNHGGHCPLAFIINK